LYGENIVEFFFSGRLNDWNWPLNKSLSVFWFKYFIMCPSGAMCLSADCCFSELAL
jgi:hypothetical protein